MGKQWRVSSMARIYQVLERRIWHVNRLEVGIKGQIKDNENPKWLLWQNIQANLHQGRRWLSWLTVSKPTIGGHWLHVVEPMVKDQKFLVSTCCNQSCSPHGNQEAKKEYSKNQGPHILFKGIILSSFPAGPSPNVPLPSNSSSIWGPA